MKLPCSKPNSRELVMLNMDEICYMDLVKGDRIRFHTKDISTFIFRFPGSLETCSYFFAQFGFLPLDSVNVVNMKNIMEIRELPYNSRIAYFEKSYRVYTSVSKSALDKVKVEYPEIAIVEKA